jgi:hypothetical protein
MSTSAPADGIVKDTVAAVGTDAFDSSGGVYTGDSSAIGKGTVTTVDADASHNGVNPGAGRGSAMNKVMVQPSGNADASHGVVNAGAVSAMSKVTVPAFSDSSVNTGGAVACISKDDDVPDGGVNMDIVKALVAGVVDKGAAFDTGTNVASAMAKEAGHGVEGTPKRRARVTRVKTATAVPQKPAAAGVGKDVTPVKRGVRKADVEKNVAPGKRSRQDRLADAVNDTGKVSEPGVSKDKGAPAGTASSAGTSATSKKATVRVKAAAAAPEKPADGADVKNEKAPRKGRSGSATGVKNEKAPGNGADAKQSTVPGNGAGAKQNTAPGKSKRRARERSRREEEEEDSVHPCCREQDRERLLQDESPSRT